MLPDSAVLPQLSLCMFEPHAPPLDDSDVSLSERLTLTLMLSAERVPDPALTTHLELILSW